MKNVTAFHGNGNSGAVDFLEEIIRNRAREVIESLYDDEVQKFLGNTAHLVDETGHRKAVRNLHQNMLQVDDRMLTKRDIEKPYATVPTRNARF